MELYVYPPVGQGLAWNGVIDQFGSLRWRRKYTEPGEFELHLPASKENVALLRPGARLQRLDCREQGEISGIKLEGEEMSVTGRMLSARLDQHIQPLFACSCSAAEAMRKTVAAGGVKALADPSVGGGGAEETVQLQARFKSDLQIVSALAKAYNLGFYLEVLGDGALQLAIYQGAVRTLEQTENAQVIFSDLYDNLLAPVYTYSATGYKNVALVAGEEAENGERMVVEVDRSGGGDRRMLYVDAGGLRREERTEEEYRALLRQEGLQKLAESQVAENFDSSILPTAPFVYGEDWALGDVVSVYDSRWGIRLDARVTEIEEVFEGGVHQVIPVLGTPLPETLQL